MTDALVPYTDLERMADVVVRAGLSEYGEASGETIGPTLLNYMLGPAGEGGGVTPRVAAAL